MEELLDLDLAGARDALRGKTVSSLELTEAYLSAMERADLLNCYVTPTPEKAREMAKAADGRFASGDASPMDGLPLGIKDLFCTEGVLTTAGSHILDKFTPTYESTVTANLCRFSWTITGFCTSTMPVR